MLIKRGEAEIFTIVFAVFTLFNAFSLGRRPQLRSGISDPG